AAGQQAPEFVGPGEQEAPAESGEQAGVAYEVSIEGIEDAALLDLLRASSQLVALADKPPATAVGLRRRATDDVGRLQTALRSEGYYDAEVSLEIDAATAPARVRLAVDRGPRYRLTAYEIDYVGASAPPDDLQPGLAEIGIASDMPARAPAVVAAEQALIGHLQERGYPFARVTDRKTFINRERKEMTVRLSADSGPAATFGPLTFTGHQSVEDSYLREIAQWPQGMPYDRRVLRDLQRRLGDTALFSTANAESAADLADDGSLPVTVTLVEREHRSIGAAAAYSTDIGPSLELFWEHRNLMGENEKLRASATGSFIEQSGEIDFRKPAFLRHDQDLLGNLKGGQEDNDAYERQWVDSLVGLERPIFENWRVSAGLSFGYEIIDEHADNGEDERSFQIFGLRLTATRDTTDDPLDPHEGSRLLFSLTPATGIGSEDLLFLTAAAGGSAYYAIDEAERFVLAGRARVGSILGEKTEALPASRRFYAGGGGSIRGYEYQLVGPLDNDEDPFGGISLVELGGELRVRVTEEFGVVPFVDGGTVYDDPFPNGDETLRWAAGLGLRYFTGFGPVRLDVAFPLNPRGGVDETFQFYVSFGQAF
ncbi:MAG TPA: autotransporter assembly complex family protein, partial [Kiloniellaceae bacterium]|nr:autotransporter assembly complex family protein [Kiloniellaceae bacterium]